MAVRGVRVFPLAHTGRLWLPISTHISTLVFGLSTLALPVDCLGDFGPCGLSVQHTQDVRGCPPTHTGCLWLSVAVRQHTHDVCGCPCVSVCVLQHTEDVRGCPSVHISALHTGRPWVSASTHRMSVAVRVYHTLALPVDCLADFGPRGLSVQYTKDVCGCPPAHTGRPWLSISTHISTLVLGLSTLAHPGTVWVILAHVGCFSVHTGRNIGRQWLSVSTHRTSVAVRVCPCVSVSTHRTFLAVHQYTYQHAVLWTQHTGPSRGLFRVILAHKGSHTGHSWLFISTHISTLVLGISTLGNPVDCLGDVAPRGLSVQYTLDVCGCPPAHIGRPWCLSAHTGRPCVSVSTQWTSVAVHQYTYQHAGPQTQHAGPSRGLFGTHRTSVGVRQHTQDVRGCSTLAFPVDSLGDFGPRGMSVQYTQDVHGCPSAHTGRPWVSISTHMTFVCVRQHIKDVSSCPCVCPCVSVSKHRTYVAVHQYTYQHYTQDVRGCPQAHTGRPWVSVSTHRTSVCVRQHTQVVRGCPSVDISACWSLDSARWPFPWTVWVILAHVGCLFSTQRTSVGVRQHTHEVCGCLCVSVCVRLCPSAHTGCPWLSISTHITTLVLGLSKLVLGLSTLALPVECLGDFGPRGLSVQYTQDIRGCPSAHTGRSCVLVSTHRASVAVRVCPSAHRTSVAVHQYTYQHVVPWTQHAGPFGTVWVILATWAVCSVLTGRPLVSASTHSTSVAVHGCPLAHIGRPWLFVWVILAHLGCLFSTHRTSVAVHQHTKDIHGCPCVSVCVRVSPSAHTGRLRLSISKHISTLVLRLSTLALPVDCSGDFGPRGLSVQYTQDIRGCPSAHTGRPCVSVSTHRSSVAVRVCPSAHTGRLLLSISTHISTLVLGLSTLTLPVDCSGDFGLCGLSVQYTQDVRGCPSAHTGPSCVSVSTHRTSVAVRVCPCVSVSTHRTSVAVHQYTYQHDVRGCPPTHIGRPWLSVSTHRTSVAVRVCPFVSVSTHRTFLAVHQYTYQHAVLWTQHTGPSRGLFGTHRTSVAVHQYTYQHVGPWNQHAGNPVDCLGDVAPRGLSVQYTLDVRGYPPAHIGRPWVFVSTHRTSVCVRQHTQVVRGCPCVSVSTHRTSVAVHQYTYQHAGP
ncbi:hypothetical protein IGI04_042887 [Brassica rapa subsp. trilocularis]|uniref:Uncharacterized protein n=1 Tax=Brassica rapa subsp. trilocularis TaxID=1813537 RepID=A0ABQ7KHA7_BRACM|nr:hypothetical protein IGI04_042887 [Brassica rapa subsp. trilocularis]